MNGAEIIPKLAAEIEALKPFADFAAATAAMDGEGGLRVRYVQKLYDAHLSAPLVQSIGSEIDRLCGREVQLLTPIQDREHAGGRGWTSLPLNHLSQAERDAL
jgi:hypothetical protein